MKKYKVDLKLTPKQIKHCKKCGKCCKVMWFPVPFHPDDDMSMLTDFYTARGCTIMSDQKSMLYIVVPLPCPHLTDNGCDIHKTKPEICKLYDGRQDPVIKEVCKLWWTGQPRNRLRKGGIEMSLLCRIFNHKYYVYAKPSSDYVCYVKLNSNLPSVKVGSILT